MSAPATRRLALATVIQAPVEATSSFVWGSRRGPAAMASELAGLVLEDPEVAIDPSLDIVLEHAVLPDELCVMPAALAALEGMCGAAVDRGAFPLTLGGEHSVTLGPLRALCRRHDGELGVVQLDAHGDLRDTYEGRPESHACVMRRAVDGLGVRLLGLGIRSTCPEEVELVRRHPRIRHLSPRVVRCDAGALEAAIDELPPNVYLTIDMDAFDPSVAPGVGTAEPGGLDYFAAARAVDLLAATRRIVGADVVELAPTVERDRTARLAARIAIRVLLRSIAATRSRR
jgi:agmatinase